MKRIIAIFMSVILLGLTACGNGTETPQQRAVPEESAAAPTQQVEAASPDTAAPAQQRGTAPEAADSAVQSAPSGSKTLIAYFSVPEDVDTSGVDAVAGASIVVSDGQVLGNNEYVAKLIQETVGGDLFRIETAEDYPLDHEPLVDQAAEEQDENARPALKTQLENPEQYDTIILGFPNWWADMPQPLYTFLEAYDFSGKTIIPFVTHGGSGFSGALGTIAELQPGAVVSDNTLSLSRNNVAEAGEEIRQWADSLGLASST